jgi:hypothetical protein
MYCCVLDRVYRAVAWQRVDQIRYNILGRYVQRNSIKWRLLRRQNKVVLHQRGSDLETQCEPVCTGWWCPRAPMGGNLITYAITINNSLKMFQLI